MFTHRVTASPEMGLETDHPHILDGLHPRVTSIARRTLILFTATLSALNTLSFMMHVVSNIRFLSSVVPQVVMLCSVYAISRLAKRWPCAFHLWHPIAGSVHPISTGLRSNMEAAQFRHLRALHHTRLETLHLSLRRAAKRIIRLRNLQRANPEAETRTWLEPSYTTRRVVVRGLRPIYRAEDLAVKQIATTSQSALGKVLHTLGLRIRQLQLR